ncbi:hypothetical protein E2320_001571, partial [Naja naja]
MAFLFLRKVGYLSFLLPYLSLIKISAIGVNAEKDVKENYFLWKKIESRGELIIFIQIFLKAFSDGFNKNDAFLYFNPRNGIVPWKLKLKLAKGILKNEKKPT